VTIAVVLTLVVALAIALVVAVARDPGPAATDVAIGYARAFATGDFDAVYRLTDPDVLRGRNRIQWVHATSARPRAALVPGAIGVRSTTEVGDHAVVELTVDDRGRTATVALVRRERVWTVEEFTVGPATESV
jgi:hypothetical protein